MGEICDKSVIFIVDRVISIFGYDVLVGIIKFLFFKVKCNEYDVEIMGIVGEIWKKEK